MTTTCAYCGAVARYMIHVIDHQEFQVRYWCLTCVAEVGKDEA